jgi:hypothetical protein
MLLAPHVGWVVEETFTEFAENVADQWADHLARPLHRGPGPWLGGGHRVREPARSPTRCRLSAGGPPHA